VNPGQAVPPHDETAAEVRATLRDGFGDRYDVGEVLGEGATAFVFRARETSPDREVAIKVLKPGLSSVTARARFQREIAAISGLLHPCILPVLDSGEIAGLLYYVMPAVRRESLRSQIAQAGPLPLDQVLQIGIDLCDALAYAHARHIVHRDLKPENVLLAGSRAILTDFGLAALAADPQEQRLTSEGVVLGTPAYLSPEQAAGTTEVGPRSDLYSLGCVLFECLTSQPPFQAATTQALLAKHISASVPTVLLDRPGIPRSVDRLLRQLLAKAPADRPRSADDVRRELSRLLEHPHEEPRRPRTVRSRLHVFALVMALPIAAIIWLYATTPSRSNSRSAQLTHIAVAPFEDLTPQASFAWLAQGLSMELIDALADVSPLEVRSFEAVRAARRAGVSLDSMRRALNVGTMVSGVLERVGTRLRLSVQLTDLVSSNAIGDVITIEADTASVDSLRAGMLTSVATELRRSLGMQLAKLEDPAERIGKAPWEAYRKAEALRTAVAEQLAAGRGRDALARFDAADTSYALAISLNRRWMSPLVGRGWLHEYRARFISDTSNNVCTDECIRWRRRALESASHAVSSSRDTLDALELRGSVLMELSRAPLLRDSAEAFVSQAEKDLVAVTIADPQRALSWTNLSRLWSRRGEPQRAVQALTQAATADPWLVLEPEVLERSLTDHRALGNLDEAQRLCELGVARYPGRVNFQQCRLIMLGERGRGSADIARAWDEFNRTTSAVVDSTADVTWWFRRTMVATVIARTGLRDSAYAVLRESRARRPTVDPNLFYQEAIAYVVANDTTRAIGALRDYLKQRPTGAALVSRERRFAAIRADPRFDSLIANARASGKN
jgi:serine/threonine-protein kinase